MSLNSTRFSYGDKALIPAPLLSISKSYQTTSDGTKIGSLYNLTINGKICVDKGSPNSNGEFWTGGDPPEDEVITSSSHLTSILAKQSAIRTLFSTDGLSLEIQPADGSAPLKCNPRVISTNDNEGIWFNLEDYTITLEADRILLGDSELGEDGFTDLISSAEETWSIEPDDDRGGTQDYPPTYRITHTVNATGKRYFLNGELEKEAWEQAKSWVTPRLGLSPIYKSGVYSIPDYYGGYNHVLSEQIGQLNGSYNVTETWILSSGLAVEDFEISTSYNAQDPLKQVTINGSVKGLDERVSGLIITSKFQNADLKWSGVYGNLAKRANEYSGYSLNIIPATATVGKNVTQGIITYSYTYNNRPDNNITGAISEVINVSQSDNVDVFAVIPIPGRTAGPIIQDIYTKKEKTKQLTMEVFFEPVSGSITSRFVDMHPENRTPQKDDINTILNTLKPTGAKVADQNQSWDGVSHYTKNITWVWV